MPRPRSSFMARLSVHSVLWIVASVFASVAFVPQAQAQRVASPAPPAWEAAECGVGAAQVTSAELTASRQRLEVLEQWRTDHSSKGPVWLMLGGVATAVGALLVLDHGTVSGSTPATVSMASVAALGLGMGASGAVWMVKRTRQRRLHDPELVPLRSHVIKLEHELTLQQRGECVDAPAMEALADGELAAIEIELARSRDDLERLPLSGPLVLTVGGGVIGGALFALGLGSRILIEYPEDEPEQVRKANAFMIAGSVGLAVGLAGTVWLIERQRARRQVARDMRPLKQRERELRASPMVSAEVAGLALHGTF